MSYKIRVCQRVCQAALTTSLVFLLGACSPESRQQSAENHIHQSQAYQQQGQYRAALIEARNAVQLAPDNSAASEQLIAVYTELGQWAQVLQLINQLDTLSTPGQVLSKANAYINLNKYRSAYLLLNQYPDEFFADDQSLLLRLRGQAAGGMGQIEEGASLLVRAAGIEQGYQAKLALAQLRAATGREEEAKAILEQLAEDEKYSPKPLLLKGKFHLRQGNYSAAEIALTDALSQIPRTDIITPIRADTLRSLSQALTMMGRSNEALIYTKLLAEALPQFTKINEALERAETLIREGKIDDAEALLSDMVGQGNSRVGTMLGVVNYLQGDYSEASVLLEEYLDAETASSQAIELLVNAKLRVQQLDEVMAILEPALTAKPSDPRLLGLTGLVMLAQGDAGGVELIAKSLEIEPNNSRLRLALVSHAYQRGDAQTALTEARLAYTYEPENIQVLGALLSQLIANRDLIEARQIVNQLQKDQPQETRSQTLAGLIWLKLAETEKAQNALEIAVKVNDENLTAWLALGAIAMGQRDYNAADTYFRYAVEIQPQSVAAYKGLFGVEEAQQQADKGIETLGTLSSTQPGNGLPQAVIAEYYLRHKKIDKAKDPIGKAIERQPYHPYVNGVSVNFHLASAQASLQNRDFKNAKRDIIQGISITPRSRQLLAVLARIQMLEGDLSAAESTIEQVENSSYYDALILRADINIRKNDYPAAITLYRKAWKILPTPDLAGRMHKALIVTDKAATLKFLEQWQRYLPKDPAPLFIKAISAQKAGKAKQAIKYYERVIALAPAHVLSLNNLAWLYYETQDSRALVTANSAWMLAPNNASVLDTYGWLMVELSDANKGLALLEQARLRAPDSEDIGRHISLAKARLKSD